MVLINTQTHKTYHNLTFRYLMDLPRCDCLYGSAREANGRIHLFLVVKGKGRIYRRNGSAGTWEEIVGAAEYSQIRYAFRDTIKYNRAPRYNLN